MSLSYFTIFNPSLGPDEESLPNQILFYTSAATSDLDTQLRNIGLVQGMIELGKSFTRQDADPINFIKSRDSRGYLLEVEPGFWTIFTLDVLLDDGTRSLLLPDTRQILHQIRIAHNHFTLENGSLSQLLKERGREQTVKIVEQWWMRWFWSWTPEGADATYLFDGFVRKSAYMSETNKDRLESWYLKLSHEFGANLRTLDILHQGQFIWTSDSSLELIDNKRWIQQYVLDFLESTPVIDPTIVTDGQSEAPESSLVVNSMKTWLSSRKWSLDTDQIMNLFRDTPQTEPDTPGPEAVQGIFAIEEPRRLHLTANTSSDKTYLNIFKFEELYFLLCTTTEDSTLWTRIASTFKATLPELSKLIKPPPKPSQVPYFFSLLFDSKTGSIFSTLPALRPASQESRTDTPAQAQVKKNTIHLHRQIYQLYDSHKHGEAVVKTTRGIWIMIKTDDLGTVVLCKSSRSGETMEEIEREGKRWIGKLRAVHLDDRKIYLGRSDVDIADGSSSNGT